jgi:hypothetical protein
MKTELNYFGLSLQEFLQNSHPQLLVDDEFISARADMASSVYEQSVLNGNTSVEAAEQSNEVLFSGLHFSKYETLKNILWNEFANEVPEEEAGELAIKLLPKCEPVFAGYPLSDGFAYEPEYELLYTELTGTVSLILDSHHRNTLIRHS